MAQTHSSRFTAPPPLFTLQTKCLDGKVRCCFLTCPPAQFKPIKLCYILRCHIGPISCIFQSAALFCLLVTSGSFSSLCNYCKDLIPLASSLPVLNDIMPVGGNSLDAERGVELPHTWLDTLTNCMLYCKQMYCSDGRIYATGQQTHEPIRLKAFGINCGFCFFTEMETKCVPAVTGEEL